jgi:hypothetical protein
MIHNLIFPEPQLTIFERDDSIKLKNLRLIDIVCKNNILEQMAFILVKIFCKQVEYLP